MIHAILQQILKKKEEKKASHRYVDFPHISKWFHWFTADLCAFIKCAHYRPRCWHLTHITSSSHKNKIICRDSIFGNPLNQLCISLSITHHVASRLDYSAPVAEPFPVDVSRRSGTQLKRYAISYKYLLSRPPPPPPFCPSWLHLKPFSPLHMSHKCKSCVWFILDGMSGEKRGDNQP